MRHHGAKGSWVLAALFAFTISTAAGQGTGTDISPKAVAHAIELSETKYCSVAATLRPQVEIQTTFEIIEEPRENSGE